MKALFPIALLLLATTGCTVPFNTAPKPQGMSTLVLLEGVAVYRQRIALPPDAVLIVRVQDVSLADAPATLIAEKRIPTQGRQVPLPYSLDYDPARILPGHRITVSGRIEDNSGRLLWITDTSIPLPEPGERADLPLVQARG